MTAQEIAERLVFAHVSRSVLRLGIAGAEPLEVVVEPYSIRQHDGDWTLCCWLRETERAAVIPLDTLTTIERTGERFKPRYVIEVPDDFLREHHLPRIIAWLSASEPTVAGIMRAPTFAQHIERVPS